MAENKQSSSHTRDNQPNQTNPVMPPMRATVNPFITAQCSQEKPCWTEDASPEKALPRFVRPEWVIVYVTVLYSFLTWLMLRSIKRQADLMDVQARDARNSAAEATAIARIAADAARMNAQAVINAERAWIVISVESAELHSYKYWATNVGKTPAKIVSIEPGTALVQRRATLPNDYIKEKCKKSTAFRPQFLPPSGKIAVHGYTIEDVARMACIAPDTVEATKARIHNGFTSLYAFGIISYYDVLESESPPLHRTTWLYWHSPSDDSMPRPDPHRPESNEYT